MDGKVVNKRDLNKNREDEVQSMTEFDLRN